MSGNLLSRLSLPYDVKKLNLDEEKKLCEEIREKIIDTVSKNGGHLASNLGVVELTLAIHRVFDSPDDKIIFDVGHQCYTHKILTGRLEDFDTLRKSGGISGFSVPNESEHDPVISGHSSTSVSSALGIAQAMKLKGDNHHAVAVIGDGALTGGLAYEGLNNAGKSGTNIVVILNYNEMSISKNIGGIAEYLSKLRIKNSYKKVKNKIKKAILAVPIIGESIKKSISFSKDMLKEKLLHSTIFEDLGFEFIGPVDGHDLSALEAALSSAKAVNGPVLVQVNTVKGKGYTPAETNPGDYHGVSCFDPISGSKPEHTYGFSDAFGQSLAEIAKTDERICAITAAMKYGTGLNYFNKMFPNRLFDVGIAEEHAVTFAAGLAGMGMIPVFAVYSSFLQRCYDQLIHDLSIGGLHCVLGVGNAGLVGEDGQTHNGVFDISFLSTVPNMTIYSPSCYSEIKYCLNRALFSDKGIAAVRYPRGEEIDDTGCESDCNLTERNSDILIIAYGRESVYAARAAEKLNCDMLKLVKIYPVEDEIISIIKRYRRAYIFEEAEFEGSVGQKLMAVCKNVESSALNGFVRHMSTCEALELYGLSEKKIIEKIRNELK